MAVEIKKINGVYMGSQEIASTALAGDANLRAYYKLADTSDSSGNGYTLTNTGTTTFAAAKFDNGADLGASNSTKMLSVASNLGINYGGTQTVCGWVKLSTEIGANTYVFFDRRNANTSGVNQLIYQYNGGTRRLCWERYNDKNGDNPKFYYNITMGTSNWYQIAYVYNGTTLYGYVNGVQVGSIASTAYDGLGTGAYSDAFNIGAWTGLTYATSGMFDDVAVFSRALTSDEIYSLYKTGVKKLNGQVNLNPELESTSLRGDANLQAYWKLEDVNDETANNRDLTNTGTVTFTTGKFGNCADTGASNSTKKLTVASNCGVAGGNISINLWFNSYAATFAGDHPPLISCLSDLTGGAGVAYGLGINTTGLFAFRLKSGVAWQETAATAILASSWYMATMTYDGTNCKLYINGNYVSQVAASGNGSTGFYADQTALFCHAGYTADAFTSAKIDDADIFNRTLTSTEISNLYNTNIKKVNGVANV